MGEVKLHDLPGVSDFCEVFHNEHLAFSISLRFFDLPDQ